MALSSVSSMLHYRPQHGLLCNGLSPVSIIWHCQPQHDLFCACLSIMWLSMAFYAMACLQYLLCGYATACLWTVCIMWHSRPQHGLLCDGLTPVGNTVEHCFELILESLGKKHCCRFRIIYGDFLFILKRRFQ